jgi:hypothetical protein
LNSTASLLALTLAIISYADSNERDVGSFCSIKLVMELVEIVL